MSGGVTVCIEGVCRKRRAAGGDGCVVVYLEVGSEESVKVS
jgi:hypothetical protein